MGPSTSTRSTCAKTWKMVNRPHRLSPAINECMYVCMYVCIYIYMYVYIHIYIYIYIPVQVQVGPEGLGVCKYRMVCPRCSSYNLAEPNVHRRNFLLQHGSPSWPLVTEWYPDFARLASARNRSSWALVEWSGMGISNEFPKDPETTTSNEWIQFANIF